MLHIRSSRSAGPRLCCQQWVWPQYVARRPYAQKPSKRQPPPEPPKPTSPDHRELGNQQKLFMTSLYSPGSPIFLPNGSRIFSRLVTFLREQYVRYGFQEVITPTIYKKSLWAKSGHLENYAEDMYSVTGNKKSTEKERQGSNGVPKHDEEDGEYGLKPMNCPGHCLVFASELRSYRDLPIRYADFSPLHRNEISGALSGLTRVRRFHQDDGHIFCRPIQVEDEIRKTLDFVKVVYSVLKLGSSFRLVLSTRPEDHYMGTDEEWNRAESALKRALDQSGMRWSINKGDGAFYGPKIDIVIEDSDGKEHQTATIQLDFQLPKRFELEYTAPAPEYEARGEIVQDPALLSDFGPVRPVMIHRAVLGSVERLMALLIERYNGKWPFWLNPRQVIIISVNDQPATVAWVKEIQKGLLGDIDEVYDRLAIGEPIGEDDVPTKPTGLSVDIDMRDQGFGAKVRDAKQKGYGEILVVGEEEVQKRIISTSSREQITVEDMRKRLCHRASWFQ